MDSKEIEQVKIQEVHKEENLNQIRDREETVTSKDLLEQVIPKNNENNASEQRHQKLTIGEIQDRLREKGLTKRELEIACAMLKGLSNREIAETLYISEATVKKHASHIFEKLKIQKREEIRIVIEEL